MVGRAYASQGCAHQAFQEPGGLADAKRSRCLQAPVGLNGISFPSPTSSARSRERFVSISICLRCLAAARCQTGSARGRISKPMRVRKGKRYPRAAWRMHLRAEPGSRPARQHNASRARYDHLRPLRGAAKLPRSREPWRELRARLQRTVQLTEVLAQPSNFAV